MRVQVSRELSKNKRKQTDAINDLRLKSGNLAANQDKKYTPSSEKYALLSIPESRFFSGASAMTAGYSALQWTHRTPV